MRMVHVTLHTACFEESLNFYQDIIGLIIERDMRPARNMVFLSERTGDTCVELIEDEKAQRINASAVSVGFHADDVEALYEKLKSAGYEVSEMIRPNPHVKFFFVNDPNGLRIQFI